MSDKLVFDLAQEVEGTPNVFVRKDWINILDNQNQNYANNQSVIDTSQLSNSNKYMSYRESYFQIPMVLTLSAAAGAMVAAGVDLASAAIIAGPAAPAGLPAANLYFTPLTNVAAAPTPPSIVSGKGADYALGLKNWFGQIIHSFTLDYNGTTIIQQTPFVNMWNSFKLMTSLSYQDVITQGATIGFYPDDYDSYTFTQGVAPVGAGLPAQGVSTAGMGTCNNSNFLKSVDVFAALAPLAPVGLGAVVLNLQGSVWRGTAGQGNDGFLNRQKVINFDIQGSLDCTDYTTLAGVSGLSPPLVSVGSFYSGGANALNALWKGYIFNRVNQTAGVTGLWQCAIMATVYLKHVHSFFNMCPLLKGVFMKMTMNLNNSTTSFTTVSNYSTALNDTTAGLIPSSMTLVNSQVPVGGVNPILIASGRCEAIITRAGAAQTSTLSSCNGGTSLFPLMAQSGAIAAGGPFAGSFSNTYIANLSVGARPLNGIGANAQLAQSLYLYIPAYTFNPVFEQAYLSSPVKQIKYTDIYQYQVLNVANTQQFNSLITNGIANIKSVLIIPFFSAGTAGATGLPPGIPCFQSPFDTAGCGTTSPQISLTNFNVQISGQNAIYNVQRYNYEEWNNQLYGQNAVNGGLTDGLTSGLISRAGFDANYGYYYVNVERMLPVEQSVPKSVQIVGLNQSSRFIDLYVFIEYGVDISIDAITGARV